MSNRIPNSILVFRIETGTRIFEKKKRLEWAKMQHNWQLTTSSNSGYSEPNWSWVWFSKLELEFNVSEEADP